MAFVDATAEDIATRYGTGSHRTETLIARGGEYPSQLKWSDLHPPGVKVLPKGSPPADPGEMNWENTLGGKFAVAIKQLEGLMYAIFGSRPHDDPGNPRWQWYDRQHPRCLWGPEIWEPSIIVDPLKGCGTHGNCWDYDFIGEYVAMGGLVPNFVYGVPSVPVRSRSGDPAGQFAAGVHNRTIFPIGSVERTQSTSPFDPKGSGDFGATQPGRQDGKGFVVEAGETVTFKYIEPAGPDSPTSVDLWWSEKPPGGAWSTFVPVSMTNAAGVWTKDIAAKIHGTEFRWFVQTTHDEFPGQLITYDPGGSSKPADEDAYYIQWFTHFDPGPSANVSYGHGLPEMLDDYGGVDVRHGTDFYQFDGSETVQPELINLLRFAVSWICGTSCLNEDTGCTENLAGSTAHHNPRFRGSSVEGLCCVPLPIRFYYSGSDVYPHYRRRGKGHPNNWGPLDTKPMKNHPDENPHGVVAARMSWRGIENLYRDDPFDNPFYGGGSSWGMAPSELQLWNEDPPENAKIYAKFPNAGLQAGDVIDPVHIQEIIDAVAYLVDNGVWSSAPICTRSRTPGTYMGEKCGMIRSRTKYSDDGEGGTCEKENESVNQFCNCWQCCANQLECDFGQEDVCNNPGFVCEKFEKPSLKDCRDPCRLDKCYMKATKGSFTCPLCEGDCCVRRHFEEIDCNGGSDNCCGSHNADGFQEGFGPGLGDGPISGSSISGSGGLRRAVTCDRMVCGMSYYICTPDKCEFGWDDDHGGSFKKSRFDHSWPLNIKATGPPGFEFSGNCWGDIWACTEHIPIEGDVSKMGFGGSPGGGSPISSAGSRIAQGDPVDSGIGGGGISSAGARGGPCAPVWFESVEEIKFYGMAVGWYRDNCDELIPCDLSGFFPKKLPPPLPGLGLHNKNGEPLCTVGNNFHHCLCDLGDWPVCKGEEVWVAADLNLDGSGRPYRNFPGRACEYKGSPYNGEGVPRLRNFDLNKDPATWMHSCPCETWTGDATCVI